MSSLVDQYLDNVRMSGQILPFTYSLFNYTVIIRQFSASFQRSYQIPFQIVLSVVENLNLPIFPVAPLDINQAIADLLAQVNLLANAIDDPGVASAVNNLQSALSAIPSLQSATKLQLQGLPPLIQAVQAAILIAITNANNNINTPRQSNNNIATDYNELTNLYYLQNITNEINKNLNIVNITTNGKIIVVTNANLFQLSAQYYNNATEWTTIAEANNMTDTMTQPGIPTTLIIPAIGINNGGILNA